MTASRTFPTDFNIFYRLKLQVTCRRAVARHSTALRFGCWRRGRRGGTLPLPLLILVCVRLFSWCVCCLHTVGVVLHRYCDCHCIIGHTLLCTRAAFLASVLLLLLFVV